MSDINDKGKRLVCPYCGDNLSADLVYTASSSYSEHRDLMGYECDNYKCDARWKPNGDVERLSAAQNDETTGTKNLLDWADLLSLTIGQRQDILAADVIHMIRCNLAREGR